jgi:hypothetical protein
LNFISLGQFKPNCPSMIIGLSSTKFGFFMPIWNPRWLPQTILASNWLISIKYYPLKPLWQMNWNLVGNIIGSSSMNIGHAVSEWKISKNRPIRNNNCLWRPCLLTDRK